MWFFCLRLFRNEDEFDDADEEEVDVEDDVDDERVLAKFENDLTPAADKSFVEIFLDLSGLDK